jgi:hypothetical protein
MPGRNQRIERRHGEIRRSHEGYAHGRANFSRSSRAKSRDVLLERVSTSALWPKFILSNAAGGVEGLDTNGFS